MCSIIKEWRSIWHLVEVTFVIKLDNKIGGFRGRDYEECRLLGYYVVWLL
jgi:hypothetical protein